MPVPLPTLEPDPTGWLADRPLYQAVNDLLTEIRDLYRGDDVPWVVGYSGGKDSTLTLMLVWLALAGLPPEHRTKTVHVISTDTGVENPVIAAWARRSLDAMRTAAHDQHLPIEAHRLTPKVQDSFWTCLIGRGYAAPRPMFRWCTERLKIRPSNAFIRSVVAAHGEVILVLGTRKSESRTRALTMARHEKGRVRDRLSPNASLTNSLVYSPIEDLSTDDVWMLLMQYPNPWGHDNKLLLGIYQGATADSECPLVVDTSTPSCGDSRMGCWTCTMVEQDKSLTAMIRNDESNAWMRPLLDLRNALDAQDDRHLRDFRRMNGSLLLHNDRLVHGPYTQAAREDWLRRLLRAQKAARAMGPPEVAGLCLITMEELHEIRRIWIFDKHEVEDLLPLIYEQETGEPFPGRPLDRELASGPEKMAVLREVCGDDDNMYEAARALLEIERTYRTMGRRAGLYGALEKVLLRHSFETEEEALAFARQRQGDQPDQDDGDHQIALF
ncbi:DNA sulfur modification protein DndC [Kitasatospora sp. MAA19]|uniref:DNA phosphorothioation system sulfurtransferase DndC n=1 Tax=unclassified Kitasatospora TaxID=2633591 RepID=UPI0024758E48|nr:DNA phosphorothioation system sulfurtransferase DndC [Kitasatospora sp. MAA19]MDH6711338.1 DNA sulfur modification protein DndC [Kitasatospora sp. MAA19]